MAAVATAATEETAHCMKAAVVAAMAVTVAIPEEAVVAMELPLMEREAVAMVSTIMDMAETRMERELLASVLSLMSLKNLKNNPNKRR